MDWTYHASLGEGWLIVLAIATGVATLIAWTVSGRHPGVREMFFDEARYIFRDLLPERLALRRREKPQPGARRPPSS